VQDGKSRTAEHEGIKKFLHPRKPTTTANTTTGIFHKATGQGGKILTNLLCRLKLWNAKNRWKRTNAVLITNRSFGIIFKIGSLPNSSKNHAVFRRYDFSNSALIPSSREGEFFNSSAEKIHSISTVAAPRERDRKEEGRLTYTGSQTRGSAEEPGRKKKREDRRVCDFHPSSKL